MYKVVDGKGRALRCGNEKVDGKGCVVMCNLKQRIEKGGHYDVEKMTL